VRLTIFLQTRRQASAVLGKSWREALSSSVLTGSSLAGSFTACVLILFISRLAFSGAFGPFPFRFLCKTY